MKNTVNHNVWNEKKIFVRTDNTKRIEKLFQVQVCNKRSYGFFSFLCLNMHVYSCAECA